MRIAYIAAGAGGMYCGSCLRDNALAAELLKLGHEVHLIPIYTPIRTDEENVSQDQIFLGGINVYLQQKFRFFRNTPAILDRLWDSPLMLRLATRWGMQVNPEHLESLTLSMLRGARGFQAKEIRRLASFLRSEVKPEIINLPNSLLAGLASELKDQTGVPICCTLQGEDLFLDGLSESYRKEAIRLIQSSAVHIDAFIAVSRYCAEFMSNYLGIPREKIQVVPLGINLEGHGPILKREDDKFTLGYMARIAPEKGLHLLCEVYRNLRKQKGLPESRLWAAGYLAPEHRPYLRDIEQKMASWGLDREFTYLGSLDRDEKISFLRKLSLLCVPSPYQEPKGLYLLEAMANGVPVVQPRKGAFTEIIQTAGGGILVEPENLEALTEGILSLWKNPQLRLDLGRRGPEGVQSHFSVTRMAEQALAAYSRVISTSHGNPAVVLAGKES